MVAGFPASVGHWREVLVFKEGSEPRDLDLRILAQWVAAALRSNPAVINVGVASRFNRILVIMSKDSFESAEPAIIAATLVSRHADMTDPIQVVGELIRNHLIFTFDEGAIERFGHSDGLRIDLVAAA